MIKIADLAARLAEKHSIRQEDAEQFLTQLIGVIGDGLREDKLLKIKGLGTFKVVSVNARESVDVNTGERIRIEGRDKVSFTPEAAMRDLVNRPFAQFETVVLNDGVDFEQGNSEETIPDDSIENPSEETVSQLAENSSEKTDGESSEQLDSESSEKTDDSSPESVDENLTEEATENAAEEAKEDVEEEATENVEEELKENVEFSSDENLSEKMSENPENEEKEREKKKEKPDETFGDGMYYDDELFDEYGYYIGPEEDERSRLMRFLKSTKTIRWLMGFLAAMVSIMFLGICVLFFEIKKRDAGIEKFVAEINSTKHKDEAALSERIMEVREAGAERFHEYDRKVDSLQQLMMQPDSNYENAVKLAQTMVREETKRKEAQLELDEQIRAEKERRRAEKERREDVLRMNDIVNRAALAREQLALDEKARQEKERYRAEEQEHNEKLRAEQERREKLEKEKLRAEEEKRLEEKRRADEEKKRLEEKRRADEEKKKLEEKRRADEEKKRKEAQRVSTAAANKSASARELEAYNSDPRVKTGAYVITGIERTVTVLEGQTFAGICKAYLGSGMECYVEAVNGGIKTVRPGQVVKIPSVKSKKLRAYEEKKLEEKRRADEEKKKLEEKRRAEEEKKLEEKRRAEEEKKRKEAQRVSTAEANKSASARDLEAYNSDPRVKTGAYVITGIERTVTVLEGQTFAGICKAYLGSGMECYVEAVNGGIKTVRPGQVVKIPSVKTKKSIRAAKK